jgi:hypothetical protein
MSPFRRTPTRGSAVSIPGDGIPHLIVWWQLDEGGGTCVFDSSGNGNGGTLLGNPLPVWTNGVMPGALQFDGSQNYVQSDQAFDQTISNYTIEAWFSATSLSGENPAIISTLGDDIGYTNLADIVLYTNSTYNGTSIGLDLREGPLLLASMDLVDGNWHQVAGVWDGTNAYLYVDGELVATQAALYAAFAWQTPCGWPIATRTLPGAISVATSVTCASTTRRWPAAISSRCTTPTPSATASRTGGGRNTSAAAQPPTASPARPATPMAAV